MSSTKTDSGNGHQATKSISRSSSLTISPEVRDGVGKIARMLVGVGGVIEGLDTELSPDTTRAPDTEGLFQEISDLQKELKETKAAQDTQIRAIRDEVKNDTKTQIVQSMQGQIQSIITDAITTQVGAEMRKWGEKPRVSDFKGALATMVEENDVLYREALIQLENSRSRQTNSTFDVHYDLNAKLKPIKRPDGGVSELFPETLRELFSHDGEQLFRLVKEHELRPLETHSENLSRFLIFIGVKASVPDQLVDSLGEHPPAYPLGNTAGARGGGSEGGARRSSSASQDARQNPKPSWPWF